MKNLFIIIAAIIVVVGISALYRSGGVSVAGDGQLVVAITDPSEVPDDVTSILMTVSEVRVGEVGGGWRTISEERLSFDLLRLRDNEILSLLADAQLPSGTYQSIRLTVDRVLVTASGEESEAKLPSGDLKLIGDLVIEDGATSFLTLDVDAGESLHRTGNDRFIFAPVVRVTADRDADVTVGADRSITVRGGRRDLDVRRGMDENGEVRPDFVLTPGTNLRLEIVGDSIKIVSPEVKEEGIQITALTATETAVASGNLDNAASVKLLTRDGRKVWRVIGLKDGDTTIVYVDAITNLVTAVE